MTPEQTISMIETMNEVGTEAIRSIKHDDDGHVRVTLDADRSIEIWADGSQYWYQRGERHRDDGPAVIYTDGRQWWWLNGKWRSEAEHARLTGRTQR